MRKTRQKSGRLVQWHGLVVRGSMITPLTYEIDVGVSIISVKGVCNDMWLDYCSQNESRNKLTDTVLGINFAWKEWWVENEK